MSKQPKKYMKVIYCPQDNKELHDHIFKDFKEGRSVVEAEILTDYDPYEENS